MWELIKKLIEEATGMTGDEAVDKIRVERGAGYVQAFKKEFPLFAMFVDNLINGSVDSVIQSLSMVNKDAARLPFVRLYLTKLQQMLRSKK